MKPEEVIKEQIAHKLGALRAVNSDASGNYLQKSIEKDLAEIERLQKRVEENLKRIEQLPEIRKRLEKELKGLKLQLKHVDKAKLIRQLVAAQLELAKVEKDESSN